MRPSLHALMRPCKSHLAGVASSSNGLGEEVEGLFKCLYGWRKAALVTNVDSVETCAKTVAAAPAAIVVTAGSHRNGGV